MHSLQFLDYLVIAAILLSLIGVGLYFTKKGGEDMDSFFVSGRSLPWYIGGTSMIATSFAADTPLWVSALVRSHGVHYIWQFWAPVIGSALALVYFGRKWRRMAFVTDVEFMEARYGGTPAKALRGWSGAWGAIIICPLISAWVIKAMETIGREAVGLAPEYQIPVTIAVVTVAILMCGLSGLFGVVYTDFIQFILATVGTVILAVLAVREVGGLDALVEQLRTMKDWGGHELSIAPKIGSGEGQMSTWNAIGFFGFLWIGVGLSGAYQAQRLLASKDAKNAAFAQLLHTVVYYSLMAWPWILVGLCSMVLIPELGVADQSAAYPRMIVMVMPVGLKGLLIAALLAAFISTISTLFNWGSSYLVNDIYRRFMNPNATEKNYVAIARVATVFMAVAGAFISIKADNMQQLLTLAFVLGSAAVVPGVLRWLWWRTTGKGELIALVVGWIMAILLLFVNAFDNAFTDKLFGAGINGEGMQLHLSNDPDLVGARMLLMVVVVGLAVIIGSLLTKAEDMNRLKAFAARARPFAFGWRPVIREMTVVYIEEEPIGRTLYSWAISLVAMLSILFGVGKLLLGPRGLGLGLVVVGAVCLVWTIRRVQKDCENDVDEPDFLHNK
jgi:SSS family solute:Na+ symporter